MAPRLLTVIRGNAILDLLKIEKGFHDGDVWGPFSFARYAPCCCWYSAKSCESLSCTNRSNPGAALLLKTKVALFADVFRVTGRPGISALEAAETVRCSLLCAISRALWNRSGLLKARQLSADNSEIGVPRTLILGPKGPSNRLSTGHG